MTLIAWRSVVRHKLRSTFLALCVVIGVAFVAGTFVLTDTIKQVYTTLFTDAFRGVAVSVRTPSDLGNDAARTPVPASLLPTVRAVPGVRVAAGGVFTLGGRIFAADGKAIGNQYAPTFVASWPAEASMTAFVLAEGRAPKGDHEVVVDRQAADSGNLTVGSTARVQTKEGVGSYTVSGIARFGDASNLGGASVAMFELPTAQRLMGRSGTFDSIDVGVENGVAATTLQDRIQAAVGPKYEAVTGTQLSDESLQTMNEGMGYFSTFMLVFAAISLFVGAFIVYNTFAIVVAQRTKEMALLRALGASGGQVIGSIVVESVIIGLLASMVGLLGGAGLALALKKLLDTLGFGVPTGAVVILPRTIAVSIFGGVAVTVVSALGPAVRAARVPPLAAVRTMTRSSGRGRIERAAIGAVALAAGSLLVGRGAQSGEFRTLGIGAVAVVLGVAMLAPFLSAPVAAVLGAPLRHLRSVSGQLAAENAARSARRTATTAAALMIGTALISASLVLATSISTSTEQVLTQGVRADLIVRTDGITGIGTKVTEDLRGVTGVGAVAAYRYAAFKNGDATKQASALDSSAFDERSRTGMLDLDVQAGSMAALDGGGIAVSKQVADDKGWKLGDIVPMEFPSGPHPQRIEAIYKTTLFGDYIVAMKTLAAADPDATDSFALVRVTPGTTPAAVKASIATLLKTAAPAAKVQDRDEYLGDVRAQVTQMLNLITALVLLALIIALLGVLITMLLSITERTHELGLLRAIGMDRRNIRSMVRWEAAMIATFGGGLGVLLGVGLGHALTRALRDMGITTTDVPFRSLVIVVLLVTIAGVAASLYPARRAGRLNVLRAIATE